MIKNIIFDMGNVLMNFRREFFFEKCDIRPENCDYLWDAFFHSPEQLLVDSGLIDYAKARKIWVDKVPPELRPEMERLTHWYEHMYPVPEMNDLGFALKESGYRIYMLSNLSTTFDDYRDRFPLWGHFDGYVLSYVEHIMKPDPEIYRILLRRYALTPAECVFIDDRPENVDSAKQVGMQGIVFPTDIPYAEATEWLKGELRRYGVTIQNHIKP